MVHTELTYNFIIINNQVAGKEVNIPNWEHWWQSLAYAYACPQEVVLGHS